MTMKILTRNHAATTLLAACCLLLAARPAQQAEPTTTSLEQQQQQQERTTTKPLVITGLLREQATRLPAQRVQSAESAGAAAATTTSATSAAAQAATTTQTSVSSAPAQQRVFQLVRANSASARLAATTATPTTTLDAPVAAACLHANRSYAIGQRWNEDCLHVCECVAGVSGEPVSACRERCPVYKDAPGDDCRLVRSVRDECCLEWACNLDAKLAPGATSGVPTSTSSTQADAGQLSTIEIRMPSSTMAPTTTTTSTATSALGTRAAPSASLVPATIVATTTTTTTTTTSAPTTKQQPASNPSASNRQQQQQTTTTAASQRSSPATSSARAPKQAAHFVEPTTSANVALNDAAESPSAAATTSSSGASGTSELEVDPETLDLCILSLNPDVVYRVNDVWLSKQCNRTCRCALRTEPRESSADAIFIETLNMRQGSPQTEIRCGAPERCGSLAERLRRERRPDCPAPRVVPQQAQRIDSCACPQISCETGQSGTRQLLTTATATTTVATTTTSSTPAPVKCRLRGQPASETFYDECHSVCRCSPSGDYQCKALSCPSEPVGASQAELDSCAEWQPEPSFKPSPANRCCAPLVCKTPRRASDEPDLSSATSAQQPDSTGSTSSSTVPSTSAAAPTAEPSAGPEQQTRPANRGCLLLGKQLAHGERVPEEIEPPMLPGSASEQGPCAPSAHKVCSCLDGLIECQSDASEPASKCPPLGAEPPDSFECPAGKVAYKAPADESSCCPRWACQEQEAFAFQISVRLINTSAVELSLSLPLFAVGQRVRVELNYTSVPASAPEASADLPPVNARWTRRPSIRTVDGILTSQLMKYTFDALRPQHRYWFKVLVRFDGVHEAASYDEPLESSLQSFVMPASDDHSSATTTQSVDLDEAPSSSGVSSVQPTTTTTTTTTSTTPLPSTRILQPISRTPMRPAPSATTTSTTTSASTTPPVTTTATATITTTTTSTTTTPVPDSTNDAAKVNVLYKPDILTQMATAPPAGPCTTPRGHENNHIDQQAQLSESRLPLHWTDQMNAPLQRYAWHLLGALSLMVVAFLTVSYLYFKKSKVIAPITSASALHHSYQNHSSAAFDNPSFTKLVSYYADHQPSHVLLVDESSQNYDNVAILAKQKNLEVDKASPLNNGKANNTHNIKRTVNNNHHHHMHPPHQIQHPNGGKQNLI